MSLTLEDVHMLLLEVHEETRALRLLIEARSEGPLASDFEVDGERGNPIAKFLPVTWQGDKTFKGKKYSECSPEFLDHLAAALTAMAAKDDREKKMRDGKPVSMYGRANAARARRWAYRKRLGWTPPEKPATSPAANGAAAPLAGSTPFGSNGGTPFGGGNPFEKPPPAPPSSGSAVGGDDDLRDPEPEDLSDDEDPTDDLGGRM